MEEKCSCDQNKILIFPCSGGSDVGEIADKVVRKLTRKNFGTMSCLSAIGARLPGFIQSAKCAELNITIDGCHIACAKKNLEHIGIKPKSYILTDMGLDKGKAFITEEIVNRINEIIKNDNLSLNNINLGSNICCQD